LFYSLSLVARSQVLNGREEGHSDPQGLKPASFVALGGTAEAVPFPNHL